MIRRKCQTELSLNEFTRVEYQRLPMSTARGVTDKVTNNGLEKVYKFTAYRYRNQNPRVTFESQRRARGGRVFVATKVDYSSPDEWAEYRYYNLYFCYTRTSKGQ